MSFPRSLARPIRPVVYCATGFIVCCAAEFIVCCVTGLIMTVLRVGVSVTVVLLSLYGHVRFFMQHMYRSWRVPGSLDPFGFPLTLCLWQLYVLLSVWECDLDSLSLNVIVLTTLLAVLISGFHESARRTRATWRTYAIDITLVVGYASVATYIGNGRLVSSYGPSVCTVGSVDVPFFTLFTQVSWPAVVRAGLFSWMLHAAGSLPAVWVRSDEVVGLKSFVAANALRLSLLAAGFGVLFGWRLQVDETRPQNVMLLWSVIQTKDWWVLLGAGSVEALSLTLLPFCEAAATRGHRISYKDWWWPSEAATLPEAAPAAAQLPTPPPTSSAGTSDNDESGADGEADGPSPKAVGAPQDRSPPRSSASAQLGAAPVAVLIEADSPPEPFVANAPDGRGRGTSVVFPPLRSRRTDGQESR